MTTTLKYTTNTTDGNRTQSTDKAKMIQRLKQCVATYEFTGGEEAICRLYLDFDYKLTPEDEYDVRTDEAIRDLCLQYVRSGCFSFLGMNPDKIAVATSSKNEYIDCKTGNKQSKYSWRFFVPSIKMKKNEMKAFVKQMNKEILAKDRNTLNDFITVTKGEVFDESVYDPNKKMRCIGTSKMDNNTGINEHRPLVLVDGTIEDTLITADLETADIATFNIPLKIQLPSRSPTSITDTSVLNDCYDELLSIIGTKGHNRDVWTKLCGWFVNHRNKDAFLDFVEREWRDDAETMFDSMEKNPREVSVFALNNLAKEVNETAYADWCNKHKRNKEFHKAEGTLLEKEQDAKYADWKNTFEKEWCKIKNTAVFIRRYCVDGEFKKFVFLNEKSLGIAYREHTYLKKDDFGKVKPASMIGRWLGDAKMRVYDDVGVYPPPMVCPSNILNLWENSPYESQPFSGEDDPEYNKEAVDAFNNHIYILCNRNKTNTDWIKSWFAHSLQRPSEKPEHALNLIGNQGIGKSTILNVFSKLYGAGKTLETQAPERDCWGNFNAAMTSAYLVILSETDKRNSFGADGKIKALITDYPLQINPKGKDQFEIRSYHRVVQLTNTADPTKTSKDDRRNFILRCNDELKGNITYFNRINALFDAPNALRSIYWYFKTFDISTWNFRDVPKTDYHKTIIEHTENPIVAFMEWFVLQHFNEETVMKTGVEMLTEFQEWKTATHYAFEDRLNEGSLLKKIKTECGLPEGCITRGNRTKSGFKNTFHIETMKSHFKLGCLVETTEGEFQEV